MTRSIVFLLFLSLLLTGCTETTVEKRSRLYSPPSGPEDSIYISEEELEHEYERQMQERYDEQRYEDPDYPGVPF